MAPPYSKEFMYYRVNLNTGFVLQWLIKHNYKQYWLAQQLQVSPQFVSLMLSGKKQPSADMRKKIMQVFRGVQFSRLFEMKRLGDL